VGEWLKPAVC